MSIKNYIKNLGLRSAGLLTILTLLLLLLIYLYLQKLLPFYLFAIWVPGCIIMIGLNIFDRKNQLTKMGEILIGKAEELYHKGEIKGAIRDFERSIEINGPSWRGHLGLGHCYRALNDYKKAYEYAKKALECKDDSAAALYLMGICLYHQDYPDSALKHLEKALRINPDLSDCYMMMGEIYASLGHKEEAVRNYTKYMETSKDPKVTKTIREKIEKLSS